MNKNPTLSSLIRLLINLGVFALMVMLYWSSSLIELDLKTLQQHLTVIEKDLNGIKINLAEVNNRSSTPIPQRSAANDVVKPTDTALAKEDINSPNNLLSPDPFYTTTLPKMLGPNFRPTGIIRDWYLGKPDTLKPFSQWYNVAEWIRKCTIPLADNKIGIYETWTPKMATSMELRESENGQNEYWINLRKDVYWQPLHPLHFSPGITLAPHFLKKHQVTAHDYKFHYDAFMNPHVDDESAVSLRNAYQDLEEVRVIDDFTLVARWKTKTFIDEEGQKVNKILYQAKSLTAGLRPLACFVYQYFADGTKIVSNNDDPDLYRKNPIWAQNFSHHWANNIIVSCGPWSFDGMTDRGLRLKRNQDFFNPYAALMEGIEYKFLDTLDSMWTDFKAGNLDTYSLAPSQIGEYEQFIQSKAYKTQVREGKGGVKRLDYVAERYSYIGWNEVNPLFQSKKVRQALTIAIDLERIIRQNFNGLAVPITGTFYPYSPAYDPSIKPYPYDPDLARQMLLEEGWVDTTGDGIIDKVIDGKRVSFRFQLTYYVKDPTLKSVGEYVATALKEVGIDCELRGVDVADLSATFEDKSFDAYMLSWVNTSPPEDPRQLWHSNGAKQKGSSNAIGFANKEIDQIIDELDYESDMQKRIALYHRFDKILYDEAPYVFLCARKLALVYRDYLQNVFIPAERQNIIPGGDVGEPESSIFWIKK